jgi:uncharacterized protein
MKSIFALALALMAGGSLATAQDATKQTKIEQILALTNADAVMDQIFAQIKTMTATMVPPGASSDQQIRAQEIQGKLLDLIKARMSWDKLRVQYVKIYDATFSDEEIDGMLAFYQSPAGRGMLKKMPQLLSQAMAIVQTQMGDIMPEIQRIVQEATKK